MPGQLARLADCGSNRALQKYTHIIRQQDALCHLLLRSGKWLWKLNTQCGDLLWKLQVPPPEQPHSKTRLWNHRERDSAGRFRRMNLIWTMEHKFQGALWNHLFQLTFISLSDKCTCPSYPEEPLFDNHANFITFLISLLCEDWELKMYLWDERDERIILCIPWQSQGKNHTLV